jgi:hypothetical protein
VACLAAFLQDWKHIPVEGWGGRDISLEHSDAAEKQHRAGGQRASPSANYIKHSGTNHNGE